MAGRLRSLYLCYLSKPAELRPFYRLVKQQLRKQPIRKITELGLGLGERTSRMLELCGVAEETTLTGIDLFEARQNGDGPGLSLKAAHKLLAATGAKVRLVPGDPFSALARTANSLAQQDLVFIAADQDRESLAKAWFYVPRMLHEATLVCEETLVDGKRTVAVVPHDEIARRAAAGKGRRAA
jgi:hypothetical protein